MTRKRATARRDRTSSSVHGLPEEGTGAPAIDDSRRSSNWQKTGSRLLSRAFSCRDYGRPGIAARMVIWCIVLGSGYTALMVQCRSAVGLVTSFTTESVALLVGLIADGVSVHGHDIILNNFRVWIIDECLGGVEAVMLVSAMLASPASWRKKALGAALGVLAVYLYNVVRIGALVLAGGHSQEWFTFLHLYLGQGTTVLAVAAVWLVWLRYARK